MPGHRNAMRRGRALGGTRIGVCFGYPLHLRAAARICNMLSTGAQRTALRPKDIVRLKIGARGAAVQSRETEWGCTRQVQPWFLSA